MHKCGSRVRKSVKRERRGGWRVAKISLWTERERESNKREQLIGSGFQIQAMLSLLSRSPSTAFSNHGPFLGSTSEAICSLQPQEP